MPKKGKKTTKKAEHQPSKTPVLKNRFKELIKIEATTYSVVNREGREFIKIGGVCIDKKAFA